MLRTRGADGAPADVEPTPAKWMLLYIIEDMFTVLLYMVFLTGTFWLGYHMRRKHMGTPDNYRLRFNHKK